MLKPIFVFLVQAVYYYLRDGPQREAPGVALCFFFVSIRSAMRQLNTNSIRMFDINELKRYSYGFERIEGLNQVESV
jgi:hypothetical protein